MYSISQESIDRLDDFLRVLPDEWRQELEECLLSYQGNWQLILIYHEETVVGGGLLFDHPTSDVIFYKDEAEALFEQNLWYIAYVWIDPDHRGSQLGNHWLEYVKYHIKSKGFWLSIEDQGLMRFYERSGFELLKSIEGPSGQEWIMTYTSN